jgi:hypothetical protein
MKQKGHERMTLFVALKVEMPGVEPGSDEMS